MLQTNSRSKKAASKGKSSKENARPEAAAVSKAVPSTTNDTATANPTLRIKISKLAHDNGPNPSNPPIAPNRRVQPSRNNRGQKMATTLQWMESDDDGATAVPGRKRNRQNGDDEQPEDHAQVPQGVSVNPMAPPGKKRKQTQQPLMEMPRSMPLFPPKPVQVGPQFLPTTVPPANPVQVVPQSQSQSMPTPTAQSSGPPITQPGLAEPAGNSGLFLRDPSSPVQVQIQLDAELDPHLQKGNTNEQQDSELDDDPIMNDDPNNADDIYSDGPNPGQYQDDEEYRDWPQESQYPIGDSRAPIIDEISSDEDEARAERLVRTMDTAEAIQAKAYAFNFETTQDVLGEHRERNNAHRPPVLGQQVESPDNNQDSGVGDNVETDESDSETSKPSSRKQRKENNPQAIGFYKAPWNRALKLAKKAYHHLIFSEHGFPIRELHLGEASRLISRIVAEMRVEDPELVFEPGIPTRDMEVLVFKEGATYRLKMKIYCQGLVTHHYASALGMDPNERFETQAAREVAIADRVSKLIGTNSTTFHFGPNDENGKKSNLMHECIAQLCVNFYYGHPGGKEPLARRYREEFRRSVPEHAVAMAATCVFHCLDEYWKGYYTPLDFSGDLYRESYESTLEMIENIKKNDYHRAKLDRARREWAQRGMLLLNPPTGNNSRRIHAVLD